MFTVIDCGTTNTRIFVVNENAEIIASGETKVGTRDTSITGSKNKLQNGLNELYGEVLLRGGVKREDIQFAIASGMITSEIGLVELPHLTAPAGLQELTEGIVKFEDGEILSLGCPLYFVRGVKNSDEKVLSEEALRSMGFMRGEEVQCMGILQEIKPSLPCNIVVLSSHTKNIYIDEKGRITASCTTISGQLYEALLSSTFLGSSVIEREGELKRYTLEELMDIAEKCTNDAGLGRAVLMVRFMQVLLDTHSEERGDFLDAVIAADDLKSFEEMRRQGFDSGHYLLFGQKPRCEMYEYMLKHKFGSDLDVRMITDKAQIGKLTVAGSIAVGLEYIKKERMCHDV